MYVCIYIYAYAVSCRDRATFSDLLPCSVDTVPKPHNIAPSMDSFTTASGISVLPFASTTSAERSSELEFCLRCLLATLHAKIKYSKLSDAASTPHSYVIAGLEMGLFLGSQSSQTHTSTIMDKNTTPTRIEHRQAHTRMSYTQVQPM